MALFRLVHFTSPASALLTKEEKREKRIQKKEDKHITACSHKYKTQARETESERARVRKLSLTA